jgi:bis(5'-nucleosyl)-tetraphosphatase (symmetrical)
MAIHAIGDVQGCAAELDALLELIDFDPRRDRLWFVGDLVNRGPQSLEVLRRVMALGDAAVTVLGNHDLHLLALARTGAKLRGTDAGLQPIMAARDREQLLDWLQSRPMLHHDATLGRTMVHAGLPPQWDLALARSCARELEAALRSERSGALLEQMYGNQPDLWHDDLDGLDRLRFITNALTRLRACDETGRMLLKVKGRLDQLPQGAVPWFRVPGRRSAGERIICGHWSAIGYSNEQDVLSLDTGCVWGGTLTAQRLDVPAQPVAVTNISGGLPIDSD